MKKFKDLSQNMKIFILLIVMALIGICLRWNTIKREVPKAFRFFSNTEQTDSTKVEENK